MGRVNKQVAARRARAKQERNATTVESLETRQVEENIEDYLGNLSGDLVYSEEESAVEDAYRPERSPSAFFQELLLRTLDFKSEAPFKALQARILTLHNNSSILSPGKGSYQPTPPGMC